MNGVVAGRIHHEPVLSVDKPCITSGILPKGVGLCEGTYAPYSRLHTGYRSSLPYAGRFDYSGSVWAVV